MKIIVASGIMLTLLLIGTLTWSLADANVQLSRVELSTTRVPQDYPTIQEAIDNAIAGDTILVSPGIYSGFAFRYGTSDISVIGLNRETTIINGMVRTEDYAGFHKLMNCTIQNGGVMVEPPNWWALLDVINNTITNCSVGVSQDYRGVGYIIGNRIVNNGKGIQCSVKPDPHTSIVNNEILNNSGNGIDLWGGRNGEDVLFPIEGNTISQNGLAGIWLNHADSGTISKNFIWGNGIGIWAGGSGGGGFAIVENAILLNSGDGIRLEWDGASVTIKDNVIKNNAGCGVRLLSSSEQNARIENNTIRRNSCGISAEGCFRQRNTIVHNNIDENDIQAHVGEVESIENNSVWDYGYPLGGNYWGDYTGFDVFSGPFQNITGSDGLGDTPYFIATHNQDNYPLMSPWSSEPADSLPPAIGNVQRVPPMPNYDEDVVVSATIVDNFEVYNAFLFYTEDASWHNVSMNRFTDLFNATIPAQPYATLVQYRIYANDTSNNWGVSQIYSYSAIDNVKPNIISSRNPTQPRANQFVKVSADVIEPVDASGVKTVLLSYRVNGGTWWNTTMMFNSTLSVYETIVPGQKALDTVEYLIHAEDNAGNDNSTAIESYKVALAGDANLDHIVDVVDAACISAHWYPGPPIGPLGFDPFYDLNGDGYVNIVDSAIINGDWKKAW